MKKILLLLLLVMTLKANPKLELVYVDGTSVIFNTKKLLNNNFLYINLNKFIKEDYKNEYDYIIPSKILDIIYEK